MAIVTDADDDMMIGGPHAHTQCDFLTDMLSMLLFEYCKIVESFFSRTLNIYLIFIHSVYLFILSIPNSKLD